jgi:glycosyltransferase involved in cell wall biosynthesis
MDHLLARRLPRSIDDTYIPEDNSQVVVYTDDSRLFPDYWPRQGLAGAAGKPRPSVSLVSTTYNETEHLAEWLESALAQTLPPDEIVITDGGSTDGTFEYLTDFAGKSPVPLLIFQERGANISRGRNIAIQNARGEIIASSDCGCLLHPDWLENLVAPFRVEPRTQVAAGWYRPIDRRGRDLPRWDWPSLGQLNPQTFIPSSRSLAFTKEAWKMAGGYPEWLTLTGEDTYFALELKRYCSRWAFVPSAVADWYGPGTGLVILKAYPWAIGDGETGYNAWEYRRKARRILTGTVAFVLAGLLAGFTLTGLLHVNSWAAWTGSFAAISLFFMAGASLINRVPLYRPLSMLAIRVAQVLGFWTGARRKVRVERRRLAGTKGVFFILAGVPIDDTGGGARCAQIAQELLRQNYWVVYINRYPRYESKETSIRIVHPNLHTFEVGKFNWDAFRQQHEGLLANLPKFALVDFPSADFLLLMQCIRAAGGTILYEMVDDWNTSLGGDWYSPAVEEEIIAASDGLVATAPVLQKKLEALSGRTALLLPNAVNSRLFNPGRLHLPPPDLPQAEWIAIYVGALWGDWFDWDLLTAAARRHPQAAFVVIGDYRGQCSDPPQNLHFLGLKPQKDLPAYLAHSDVALIPWKVNEITQATSPLKLYEYLAMHLPVVAPNLKPLGGMPGVHLAVDAEEFLELVGRARLEESPTSAVDEFIRSNNWQERLARLLEYASRQRDGLVDM